MSEFEIIHTLLYFQPYHYEIHFSYSKKHYLLYAWCRAICSLYCFCHWSACVHYIQTLLQGAFWASKGCWRSSLQALLCQYALCHSSYLIWKDRECCPGDQGTHQCCQPTPPATIVHWHLKKTGMKAVVKSKCPLLSVKHCKAHLDYAYTHKDWTVEDWKKVVWSDETKINCLGSDGCKWV